MVHLDTPDIGFLFVADFREISGVIYVLRNWSVGASMPKFLGAVVPRVCPKSMERMTAQQYAFRLAFQLRVYSFWTRSN
jgi:hypothetical protein